MVKPLFAAAAILLGTNLIFLYPVLFCGLTFFPLDQLHQMHLPFSQGKSEVSVFNHFMNDALLYFYPAKQFARENLLQGVLSYWNPLVFGGYPQYAATQAASFDPTNFLLLLLPLPAAFHWQVALQLWIAGIGMFLLLAGYRLQWGICLVFASAYAWNSMFVTKLLHHGTLGSFCWVPFALFFLRKSLATRNLRSIALFGATLACAFLGGNLQYSAFALLVVMIFFLLEHSAGNRAIPERHTLMIFGAGVGLAFSLSALMWLPSVEFFWLDLFSGRARGAGDHKSYSLVDRILSVPLLFSFFLPQILGSPRALDLAKIAHSSMVDFTAFLGLPAATFGTWGAVKLWKSNPRVRPYVIGMALSLIIPIATPLYRFFYHRFFVVYVLCLAVVAAFSVQQFLENEDARMKLRKWVKALLAIFSAVLFSLGAFSLLANGNEGWKNIAMEFMNRRMSSNKSAGGNALWFEQRLGNMFEHFSFGSTSLVVPLVFSLLFLAVLLWRSQWLAKRAQLFLLLLFLITLSQAFWFARSMITMVDPAAYPFYPATKETEFLKRDPDLFRVLPLGSADAHPVFHPNILASYGIATLSGYESLVPASMASLGAAAGDPPNARLLGLANVKYVATNRQELAGDANFLLEQKGAVQIYRNKRWKPRAYLAFEHSVVASRAEALQAMQDPGFDGATVLLLKSPGFSSRQTPGGGGGSQSVVRWLAAQNNFLQMEVIAEQEGWLVVADSDYPGWKAEVNGLPAEIFRANAQMRAVRVPQGLSSVEFRFAPKSFAWGAGISLAAAVLLVLAFFLGRGQIQLM